MHTHTNTPSAKLLTRTPPQTSAANKPSVHSHTHPGNGPATIIVEQKTFHNRRAKKNLIWPAKFSIAKFTLQTGPKPAKTTQTRRTFCRTLLWCTFHCTRGGTWTEKVAFLFRRLVPSSLVSKAKKISRERKLHHFCRIEAQTPVHDDPHTVTDGEDCRNDEESQIKWRRRLLTRSRTHGPRGESAADVTDWRGAGDGGSLPLDSFFGKNWSKFVQKDILAGRFKFCVT